MDRELALSARASCPRFKSAGESQSAESGTRTVEIGALLCALAEAGCVVIANVCECYYVDFFPEPGPQQGSP
jgi:hypothetical protein